MSTQFSSIWPISGATTPGQSGPWNDDNEGILRIPQISSITAALLSDFLVSYFGHSLRGDVLPLFRKAVGIFYSSSRLGNSRLVYHSLSDVWILMAM